MSDYEIAPLPDNEQQRLAELNLLKVLDTASEERFDRFTQFAADVFNVAIALVSLVDQNRQWFKSACGFTSTETNRDVAFCAHAILEPKLLIIPDATLDKRFHGSPLVISSPYIRFYAGAVLRGPSSLPVGTLCLIDSQPREFNQREINLLLQLARLVEHELQQDYRHEQFRKEIENNAYYDALTGLPNKRLLHDRLIQAIALARRSSQRILIIHTDIDRFTAFNTAFGKDTGDLVLKKCAQRLREHLDVSCTVSRWQNDQFTLLVSVSEIVNPETVIKFIHQVLGRPFEIQGQYFSISMSSGISIYPNDSIEPNSLFEKASLALHQAHSDTKINYQFFCEKFSTNLTRRTHIESRLRYALKENELSLVYQPIVNLKSGDISGVEALCRWNDSEFGPITPDEFIAVAEYTGIIGELSNWVILNACNQGQEWRNAGHRPLKISINITSNQIRHPTFSETIKNILAETGFDSNYLILELTESCFIDDPDTTIKHMNEMRNLGVHFAIDDFGIGFSSFSYLQSLPAQILKLDRAFITEMTSNENDATIAHTIISMAKNLNMSVTAEGVENVNQLYYLKAYQCDSFQGFLFSPPVSAEVFTKHMLENKRLN